MLESLATFKSLLCQIGSLLREPDASLLCRGSRL